MAGPARSGNLYQTLRTGREIMIEMKFRGKRIDDGEWVYGSYIYVRHERNRESHFVQEIDATWISKPEYSRGWSHNKYEVRPESIGQFTGRKDKKRTKEYPEGQEIYKGDTLKNPNDPRGNKLFDVAWSEMFHGWIGNSQTECLQMKPCVFDECEVVGNIYDNPKLLEGK